MCRAPFTTVLMAALLGAAFPAATHSRAAASVTPSPSADLQPATLAEPLDTGKAYRSNTVSMSPQDQLPGRLLASAYRDTDRAAPPPPTATTAKLGPGKDAGWRYSAAMLGTLAIIVTIAVRRRKAEKPWA